MKIVLKSLDIKVTENEIKMVLKQMDTNGDGEISFEGRILRFNIFLKVDAEYFSHTSLRRHIHFILCNFDLRYVGN